MVVTLKIIIPPLDVHPAQREILEHPARFKVASCGRRFGKSLLGIEWLVLMPGGAIDGYPVAWFAPEYKYIADVWSAFIRTLKPVIESSNKNEGRISLITGGVIDIWSMDNRDAGRSRKYKRVVVDEAAHCPYLQEVWDQAISPTLTDYQGEAWILSTPKGINYFYALHSRGNDPDYDDWASFNFPTSSNPHINQEEIANAKRSLPELVFNQEYLAKFVTFGSGMVRPEHLLYNTAPPGISISLGVDLAISDKQKSDFTAIAAVGRDDSTGMVYVVEVERYRCSFNEILGRIKAAAARHNPTMINIESTQFQSAVVQELTRTTKLPIRGIRPDKDKITRFLPMLTRYEQRLVRHDPARVPTWFGEELISFPESSHDDGVDALVYAFMGSNKVATYVGSRPTI